ncbi:MAG TPA: hypothetical protein VK171_05715 [Fimbriimonas sp.]|nr:hypothetical protein [Fimbriimonas sp.]
MMQPESLRKQLKLIHQAHRSRDRDTKGDRSTLSFAMEPFTDEGLELLTKMRPDLRGIYLMQTQITDAGIPLLNRFRCLEELIISGTKVTKKGLDELNLPALNELGIPAGKTSVALAEKLAALPQLECVHFDHYTRNTATSVAALEELVNALCQSRTIKKIVMNSGLQGDCYESMSRCYQLEEGRFVDCGGSYDQWGAIFQKRNWLHLTFSRSTVPAELLKQLRGMDQLEGLGIAGIEVPDDLTEIIVSLPNLTSLWLEDIKLTRDKARRLKDCPKLNAFEGNIDGIGFKFWLKLFSDRENFWLHP